MGLDMSGQFISQLSSLSVTIFSIILLELTFSEQESTEEFATWSINSWECAKMLGVEASADAFVFLLSLLHDSVCLSASGTSQTLNYQNCVFLSLFNQTPQN